jgi:hypothetical protein
MPSVCHVRRSCTGCAYSRYHSGLQREKTHLHRIQISSLTTRHINSKYMSFLYQCIIWKCNAIPKAKDALTSCLPLGLHDSSRAWIDATRGCREPEIVAYGPLLRPGPVPSPPIPLLCQAVLINQRPLLRTQCDMVGPTHVFCFDYPFVCSYGRDGRPIKHPTPFNQESNLFVL